MRPLMSLLLLLLLPLNTFFLTLYSTDV